MPGAESIYAENPNSVFQNMGESSAFIGSFEKETKIRKSASYDLKENAPVYL